MATKKEKNAPQEFAGGCGETLTDTTDLSHIHHMAWYQLLRSHAAVNREIERRLDKASKPVTLGWYDVLVTLEKAPEGRLRMSELADHVLLSYSGLTRLVDKIEAAGLLRREMCPGDRRVCYAAITEAGLEWRRAAWPSRRAAIIELFSQHISEEEARTIEAALRRVADAAVKGK